MSMKPEGSPSKMTIATTRFHICRAAAGAVASVTASLAVAQQVTITAAFPTPIPGWIVFASVMMLTVVALASLRHRLPKSFAHLRNWPLIVVVASISVASLVSAASSGKSATFGCTACAFTMTNNPATFGPVDWDTDIAVTNGLSDLVIASISATCPSYAPCTLAAPSSAVTSPPACTAGSALARNASCRVRIETHAGTSLFSSAAGKFVTNTSLGGPLTVSGQSSNSSFSRIAMELSGANTFTFRSLVTGKYFAVHPADSVVYADANDQPSATGWVVFALQKTAQSTATSVVILKDGPPGATVDTLQFDPGTNRLRVVALAIPAALGDPNSQFVIE